MGFIYKITSQTEGKSYIGQTITKVNERFTAHKKNARKVMRLNGINESSKAEKKEGSEEVKDKPNNYNIGCRLLIDAMIRLGIDDFSVETVEEVKDEEMNDKEIFYIGHFNTLTPNGYNIMRGGAAFNKKACSEIHSEVSTEARKADFEDFRVHSELLESLPQYCINVDYNNDFGEHSDKGFAVNKHPKCQRKFFSFKKYGSVEAARAALLEFYATLENAEAPVNVFVKSDGTLPKGISKRKNGSYHVDKKINGVSYIKNFALIKGRTDEQARNMALAFLKAAEENAKNTSMDKKKTGPKVGTMKISRENEINPIEIKIEEPEETIKITENQRKILNAKKEADKFKRNYFKKEGKGETAVEYIDRLKKEVAEETKAKAEEDEKIKGSNTKKLSKAAEDANCLKEARAAKDVEDRSKRIMENISNLTQAEANALFSNKSTNRPTRKGGKPLNADEIAAKVCDTAPKKTARDVAAEKKAVKEAKAAAKAAKATAKAAKAAAKTAKDDENEVDLADSEEAQLDTTPPLKLPIPPTKVDVKNDVKKIVAKATKVPVKATKK